MPIENNRHQIPLGVAYSIATLLVASSASATAKYLGQNLSPWMIVFIQYLICTLILLPWLWRQGSSALKTSHLRLHSFRALSGWVGFCTFYLALPHIPLVDATLMRAAAPLWTPLIIWGWLQIHIPAIRWVALAGGFIGILLILKPGGGTFNQWHLVAMLAGIGLAASMVTTRALSATEPAFRVLFYYFSISALATLPFAMMNWQWPAAEHWPGLVYIGLSIFITMMLYTRSYTYAPTTILAPLSYLAIPVSGLIGWMLWGHVPDSWAILGICIVILSGIFASTVAASNQTEH